MDIEELPQEVVSTVREVVGREMRPFGLAGIDVALSTDSDGDSVILVEAKYRNEGRPVDPKVVAGLVSKLRDRLWRSGERRFPHIRHHFAPDQQVAGTRG